MMLMRNIKEGVPVTLEQIALAKSIKARFFFDEDGREWYESQKLFRPDTLKIAFERDGVIRCVQSDISLIFPENMSVAEVVNTTANRRADNTGNWMYRDGEIIKRIYSPEELQQQAENKKALSLAAAEIVIAPLTRAVKLGIATVAESQKLEAWERYSVLVSRVDTLKPVWPDVPA